MTWLTHKAHPPACGKLVTSRFFYSPPPHHAANHDVHMKQQADKSGASAALWTYDYNWALKLIDENTYWDLGYEKKVSCKNAAGGLCSTFFLLTQCWEWWNGGAVLPLCAHVHLRLVSCCMWQQERICEKEAASKKVPKAADGRSGSTRKIRICNTVFHC